jgi:hypothetical protein
MRENFGDRFQVVLARSTSLRQDRKDAKQHAVFPNGHEVVLILWGGALSMETLHPSDAPSYRSYIPLQLRAREMDKQHFFSKWMQPRRPSQRKSSRTLLDLFRPFTSAAHDVSSCVDRVIIFLSPRGPGVSEATTATGVFYPSGFF